METVRGPGTQLDREWLRDRLIAFGLKAADVHLHAEPRLWLLLLAGRVPDPDRRGADQGEAVEGEAEVEAAREAGVSDERETPLIAVLQWEGDGGVIDNEVIADIQKRWKEEVVPAVKRGEIPLLILAGEWRFSIDRATEHLLVMAAEQRGGDDGEASGEDGARGSEERRGELGATDGGEAPKS